MTAGHRPTYREAYDDFDLRAAHSILSGGLEGPFNAAAECCDRHCGSSRPALIWQSADGRRGEMTFDQLRDQSSRFAHFLVAQGVRPGDRIAGLLPRTPELLVTIVGTWRAGAVYQPLFTAFGPKAIEHRLHISGAKLVVTDDANRSKLEGITWEIVTVGTPQAGDLDFHGEVGLQAATFAPISLGEDDPFLIMFTSGTTGPSKALLVPIKALCPFALYVRDAVGVEARDRFWHMADPGWAYGLYYAVAGPLALGQAVHFYDGSFTVDSCVRFIGEHRITNLAGAPTAYRLMMGAGADAVGVIKGQLRAVSSAGEPLNPEVIRWFAEHLGVPIHDHYGQTEIGMVVCNHHGLDHPIHVGAAGVPVPGHRVVVLDESDRELPPGEPGILAVDHGESPLFWFAGYEGGSSSALGERYYRTGDTMQRNEDGSISFVGRSDDVITSAGYRIGPFDVESALIEHPAVLEAAAVGKPDSERTEIVKAFVVLRVGHEASDELVKALQTHVRQRLSAHAYPREIAFVEALPKTPSGKIQRFILRNQEIARSSP
jgi:acetyl-CoA synthetase